MKHGTIFKTKRINGLAAVVRGSWKMIEKKAAQYENGIVEVRDGEKEAISDQQRAWLHCDSGPIRMLMAEGWSVEDAKLYLKTRFGRHIFVQDVTGENFQKVRGILRWECHYAFCEKLVHPIKVQAEVIDKDTDSPKVVRRCPYCRHSDLRLIAIQSIMDTEINQITEWFEQIFNAFPDLKKPDKEWRTKAKGK